MTESTYEAVPYDDRPVAETHPDRIHVAARLLGIAAAPPTRMRVLELGCAHGVNLVPMAFHLPEAQFVGIDLSPRQIAVGRARVEALGLHNLDLRCADVMDFDPGPEPFDLVIAHGLLSWVPEAVGRRALEVCRTALGPTGVAYVSYNTLPAWGVRGAIRRALLALVADCPDDRSRLAATRAAIARLAAIQPLRGTAEGALLEQELSGLHDKPDAYLLHEYLEPHLRAFWLTEFVALAASAGLRWRGDVAPTGLPPAVEAETDAALSAFLPGEVGRAELADIVTFRQFRASLLVRDDAPAPTPGPDLAWWSTLHLSAPPSDAPDDPTPALTLLRARWPHTLPFLTLAAALDPTGPDPRPLVAELLAEHRTGRVILHPRPGPQPLPPAALERPAVSPLSRFEARHLPFVTTPAHAWAPVGGLLAALLQHLDGTRTRPELVEALVDDVMAGRLRVAAGPAPTRSQLQAGLPRVVEVCLQQLRDEGLLVAD